MVVLDTFTIMETITKIQLQPRFEKISNPVTCINFVQGVQEVPYLLNEVGGGGASFDKIGSGF